ncbi:hypothetical protein ETB97_009230 [Aspergillus alliaceus]|uniref:Uncharacterized protein n=1 Tax=Petromyces alliaceus TaxID=209559 RepID=A0A5N6G8S3_PETAA|nr:uncharacterized protein BDW43DRAFT_305724 [Aspergillus alliaceus]KAB8238822.1 hypothetical protein BDW43DRAFT_305724 [Aspergillus alliaceus]KAF5855431.1 hypothetical protein ETB97_009230 [Aspergillus burnettii]
MGNICSRSRNEPEAFTTPGRVLGSANPPPGETGESSSGPRAPLPAKASTGRPLGGAGAPGAGPDTADARANAAIAAQKRAESASAGKKGSLGSKLAAQGQIHRR